MTTRYWPAPKPGDIVHCRFPEDEFDVPGPKERPALVTHCETRDKGIVDVQVAYGTSQGIDKVHAGEMVIPKSEPGAGLHLDTKFDLGNLKKLPFNSDWFGLDLVVGRGKSPKMGKIDFELPRNKRKLQAAVTELKAAGVTMKRPKRFEAEN